MHDPTQRLGFFNLETQYLIIGHNHMYRRAFIPDQPNRGSNRGAIIDEREETGRKKSK